MTLKKIKAPIAVMSNRDHLEKLLVFQHNNKEYVFFSAVPDDLHEKDSKFERVRIIFAFICISKTEDGKTQVHFCQQLNFPDSGIKASLKLTAMFKFLPKGIANQYKEQIKYIEANQADMQ